MLSARSLSGNFSLPLCLFPRIGYNQRVIDRIEELETAFSSFEPSTADGRTRERRLERMERLLSFLGNPERAYRTYHVAGSKGKGSTAAYLAALITGTGRKCGLYTSPHLFTVRERFTISGAFFPDRFYIDVCNEMLEAVSSFTLPPELGPEKPTVFEMYTAFGYMLFKESGCTDAVIETGLGGRLDATNTIRSDAVFITPIEMEHQDVLGPTIKAIATEKAGIITSSAPVFTSFQKEEAGEVFRNRSALMGAPLFPLEDHLGAFRAETTKEGEKTSFTIDGMPFSLTLSMSTKAMAYNAALALLGASKLSLLSSEGLRLMEKMQLPGRFERRIIDKRLVVIDTAHTKISAAHSAEAFRKISGDAPVLILALVSGKDEDGIIRSLLPHFSSVIITKPSSYRKSDPSRLAERARSLFPDKDIRLIENPDTALDSALALPSDILITGSFYLAGEMERLRKEYEP